MPARWTVQVTVFADAAELLPEVRWWRVEVEPRPDGSCVVRSSGDALRWLAVHLSFLPHEYRIDGPPEFIAFVREDAARRLRAVGAADAGDRVSTDGAAAGR